MFIIGNLETNNQLTVYSVRVHGTIDNQSFCE